MSKTKGATDSKPRKPRDYAEEQRIRFEAEANSGGYWTPQVKHSEKAIEAMRKHHANREGVNTNHRPELPLTLRGQVGQVTSYNPLPARSK